MFLKRLFDTLRLQSVARLAGLQLLVLISIVGAVVTTAHWNMRHDLAVARRHLRLRELAELAEIYNQGGWNSLKQMALHTMSLKEERAIRVTDAYATKLLQEELSIEMRQVDWTLSLPVFVANGETGRVEVVLPTTGEKVKVIQAALKDGNYLWLAETERTIADQAWASTFRLALLGSVISLLGVIPVLWFAKRVYEPLEALRMSTDALRSKASFTQFQASSAIPELLGFSQSVSTVINERVAQISTLSGELNSVNEHLAHELKTPLARIRGDLEDLLDHYGKPDGEDAAVRGMDEIDRASQLVQTILAIRLGDTGSMRLHLEMVSPKEMLDELMEMYLPAAEDREQTLTFTVHQDALVLLDRHRVRQAIVNLLDNALAYTPEGGSVHLVQEVDELGYLLRVQDSGPGLTAGDMDRIWKRFSRGSAASARAPGTGLGLSLVRAVARAHYGEAHAQNREGGGAEFWLRLPLTPYPVNT
jgi:signal transduction histidine kinase